MDVRAIGAGGGHMHRLHAKRVGHRKVARLVFEHRTLGRGQAIAAKDTVKGRAVGLWVSLRWFLMKTE